MISDSGFAPSFQPSSRRQALSPPGVVLHDRAVPGLLGSTLILTVIILFVAGLIYGSLDHLVDALIQMLVR